MEVLIGYVIWAMIAYFYASSVKKRYEDIDITPTNYIIGGFLFGLFSIIWCFWKQHKYFKNKIGR